MIKVETTTDGEIELDIKGLAAAVAEEAFSRIVRRTPVDTGAARDAWRITAKGSTNYEITNPKPYISRLEKGWSGQAPSGMVRITLEEVPTIIRQFINSGRLYKKKRHATIPRSAKSMKAPIS